MNKLTKIGVSALCGSLAAVSATYAGAISVSGGATATYTSLGGKTTGNPIGVNSGLTMSGSGELDNGTTFALTITQTDAAALSAAGLVLDTPSFGSFAISRAQGGGGIGSHDDKMPTAWEETTGTGMGTGIDYTKGVGSSTNVQWTSPNFMGIELQLAYAPRNDGKSSADKGVGGDGGYKGAGTDILLDIKPGGIASGLNIYAGYSETERDNDLNNNQTENSHEEGVAGLTYAIGPLTVGYMRSGEFTGHETASLTEYYSNEAFGVSFNINDNLSVSYGEFESMRHKVGSGHAPTANKKIITTADSLQLSYTMGGASIQIADSSVDNSNYATAASADFDGMTLRLSLAF